MNGISKNIVRSLWIFLAFGFLAWAVFLYQLPDDRFHVYFLDVGQGDSILIKTPENQQILIDGGPANYVIEQLAKVLPFFDRSIDLVVLTHPHADHLDGLIEVLKRYTVGAVLITGVEYNNATYREFLAELVEKNIPVYVAESKNDLRFGQVFLDIIYPFEPVNGDSFNNVNNSSIAMMVHYGNEKILLTGDDEVEVEKELIESGIDLKADIYKASHHGSATASSPEFLAEIKPEIAVISVGKDNKFGHPHAAALKNLRESGVGKIYRTDLDGLVQFEF